MKTRDEVIDWLRDAYAMERGLEISLKKQSEHGELSSAMREQAAIHLGETRRHAEAVRACLEKLGSDTSTLKTGIAQSVEAMKGMGTMFASDERVKDLLAAYASEHFEIVCYLALRAAAEFLGETEIVAVCDLIIPDEERMAQWLTANLPSVVQEYLAEAAMTSK
jgi:ferritin-like metal-binding protein YciE